MIRPSLSVAVCVLALVGAPAAQQPGALQAAANAIGALNVRTLQFTGTGQFFVVGQNVNPSAPWPRFTLRSYTAAADYSTGSMRVDFVRAQAENPPRGGGNQPLVGAQRQVLVVSGETAWNEPAPATTQNVAAAASAPLPQPPATAEERMLQIHLTPHGFLRAALAANATTRIVRGATEATYTVAGRFRVVGTINARNEVERVQTWIDHPVLGDMLYEAVYSGYRNFNGVTFPVSVIQRQGGHPVFNITVATVRVNDPIEIAIPDAVRSAAVAASRVTVDKVADGVYYLTGGTHHSVAVEMRDHIVVIEGPLNDERATAVIARVRETIPEKPIRYVVNTHHHFDHSGGLRAFADEGATIVTHQLNRPFYEQVFAAPHTLTSDRLARSKKRATIETVTDRQLLTDGTRTIELYHLAGSRHDDAMLIAYLPRERVLVEADVLTVAAANGPVPATPNPFTVNLYDNIQRLQLAPARILGLHGVATDMTELRRLIGR